MVARCSALAELQSGFLKLLLGTTLNEAAATVLASSTSEPQPSLHLLAGSFLRQNMPKIALSVAQQ